MRLHLRILTLSIGISIALTFAGMGSAGTGMGSDGMHGDHPHGFGDRDHGPERFIERHADELGLSPETRAAIEKIAADSRARSETLREASKADYQALRALLEEPLPDEAAVMALHERIGANRQAAKRNRLEAMLAVRKLLTDEQRAKLVEIRESKFRGRHKGGPIRACLAAVAEFCPEAEPGRPMLQCIVEQWDRLSEECQSSFERGDRRQWHGRDADAPEAD